MMGNTLDLATDNQYEEAYQYNRLLVALEASQGKLDLLIAVCEDRNLQAQIIERYEQELGQQGIRCLRVWVQAQDPSLRLALERLVAQEPALQTGQAAVVTVQGIDSLIAVRLGEPQSQQEQFFGYLQWTREAFRQFHFPVVVWVTGAVLTQLAERSPDFWSWRGGVFWFGLRPEDLPPVMPTMTIAIPKIEPAELQDLLQQIEDLEKQPEANPAQLASLFEKLGELYANRVKSGKDRQFAIQAYKRAIQLQTQLGKPAELARSWERLGDLYFELRDDVGLATEAYNQALQLYREVGDRLGEANTLRAIGDVLQFLNQSREALQRYDAALALYRDVGDRLGEAYTLQAIGDVLQFLDQRSEALQRYDAALALYREVGSRLGEANTLRAIGDVLQFLKQSREALQRYDAALALFREVGARLGEANTLRSLGEIEDDPVQALAKLQQAQQLYEEIGDRYSQSRNLVRFQKC